MSDYQLPLIYTSVIGSYAWPGWLHTALAAAGRGEYGPEDWKETQDDAVDLAIHDQETDRTPAHIDQPQLDRSHPVGDHRIDFGAVLAGQETVSRVDRVAPDLQRAGHIVRRAAADFHRRSGGKASVLSRAIASSSGRTRCCCSPRLRRATVPSAASRFPTTSMWGTLPTECSRTL